MSQKAIAAGRSQPFFAPRAEDKGGQRTQRQQRRQQLRNAHRAEHEAVRAQALDHGALRAVEQEIPQKGVSGAAQPALALHEEDEGDDQKAPRGFVEERGQVPPSVGLDEHRDGKTAQGRVGHGIAVRLLVDEVPPAADGLPQRQRGRGEVRQRRKGHFAHAGNIHPASSAASTPP